MCNSLRVSRVDLLRAGDLCGLTRDDIRHEADVVTGISGAVSVPTHNSGLSPWTVDGFLLLIVCLVVRHCFRLIFSNVFCVLIVHLLWSLCKAESHASVLRRIIKLCGSRGSSLCSLVWRKYGNSMFMSSVLMS